MRRFHSPRMVLARAGEFGNVKPPEALMDLYFKSVGRGASFLLNVPPDRRGLVNEADAASLRAFGKMLKSTFSNNLARNGKEHRASAKEIALELPRPVEFDTVRIREAIQYGQRIEAATVEAWQDSAWREIGAATSIGGCRLIHLASPLTASKVRLRVTASSVEPIISEFALFRSATS